MTSNPNFDEKTTASEVAEAFRDHIKGRTVAITGVSRGGIGAATAIAFAKHDPTLLILVSRTQSKLDEVAFDAKVANPNVNIKTVLVELTSQASVRHAASEIKSLTPRLDILINNAGLCVFERRWSPENIELQLAGNHIGHFLLTNLLKDSLLAAAEDSSGSARVVNVSSDGHFMSPFRFHDYNMEGKTVPQEEEPLIPDGYPEALVTPVDGYAGITAYCHTKTANVLFTVELNRRLRQAGIKSHSLNPGAIETDIYRNMDPMMRAAVEASMEGSKRKNIDQGAATTMVAALDPALDDVDAFYLNDCQIKDAAPHASDADSAQKLWELSERLVHEKF